ncbi:NAD-dependent epimerase/dehydratase family protein [Candidatus Latescibacterota bacterium]
MRTRALLHEGAAVRVLDNFSTGKRSNLGPHLQHLELKEGDLRSFTAVQSAVRGMEVVFHLGALPSVPRSVADPLTTNEVNVLGTLHVLEAARDSGAARVVFASSASVCGAAEQLPVSESLLPDPISPYGVSKLAGETYCQCFARTYGVEAVALRYFNVFGPAQDRESSYTGVMAIFMSRFLDGGPLTIDGDGEQTKDFTYVDNVVHANLLAAQAEAIGGEVFNAACGSGTSVNQIVEILKGLSPERPEITHGPPRVGDIRHSRADISKAREVLGFEPLVDAEEGIRRTFEWYRTNRKP